MAATYKFEFIGPSGERILPGRNNRYSDIEIQEALIFYITHPYYVLSGSKIAVRKVL